MLVLARKQGEVIKVGDDLEITVVDITGDKVRLGITAPRQVQVHRKEVYDAIQRQKPDLKWAKPAADTMPESSGAVPDVGT